MSSLKNTALPASDIKATIKDIATGLGFDLVRVTSAEEFADDRKIALERIQDGLMDGLPWYTPARVKRGTTPQELLPGLVPSFAWGSTTIALRPPRRPSQAITSSSPAELPAMPREETTIGL